MSWKAAAFAVSFWLSASLARAEVLPCSPEIEPAIALETELDTAIADHLAAALAARGFTLCRGAPANAHIAALHIELLGEGQAVVARIELSDTVTRKRVERKLELGALPADSRPLAIAASADELLRASWAELTLVDAPPPAKPPPPAVTRAVASTQRETPRVRSAELDITGSVTVQRRRTALGARLQLGYWLTPRIGVFMAPAFASGLARSAEHGSVAVDASSLEMGLMYGLTPHSRRFGAAVEGGVSALRLSFNAQALPLSEANSFSDWSLMSSARLRGWLGSEQLRATLSLGAVYGLRPSRAYDDARIVTSNEGAGLEALAGVALFL